jgi:hypothetical protein
MSKAVELGLAFSMDPEIIFCKWPFPKFNKVFEIYFKQAQDKLIIDGFLHDKDLRNDEQKQKAKEVERGKGPDMNKLMKLKFLGVKGIKI